MSKKDTNISTYFCCFKLRKAVLTTKLCEARSQDPERSVCFSCNEENGPASKLHKGGMKKFKSTLYLESILKQLPVNGKAQFRPKSIHIESARHAARRYERAHGLQYNISSSGDTLHIERMA